MIRYKRSVHGYETETIDGPWVKFEDAEKEIKAAYDRGLKNAMPVAVNRFSLTQRIEDLERNYNQVSLLIHTQTLPMVRRIEELEKDATVAHSLTGRVDALEKDTSFIRDLLGRVEVGDNVEKGVFKRLEALEQNVETLDQWRRLI